ncbi:MAG TPA: IPT/TIG domain-containing protein, partial [Pyrinomonadaceae bacterium]
MIKLNVIRTKKIAIPLLLMLVLGAFSLAPLVVGAYSHVAQTGDSRGIQSPSFPHNRKSTIRQTVKPYSFLYKKSVAQPLTDSPVGLIGNGELFTTNVVSELFASLVGPARSNSVLLTAPSITGLSPDNAIAGSSSFTLVVSGTDFGVDPVTINFGGTPHAATIEDATHVSATISAGEIATAGSIAVNVTNAASETSTDLTFTVNNPVAVLSSLAPSSVTAGQAGFALTINGSSFVSGAQVKFNGSDRATTFVDNTELTASISAADIATAGTFPITVVNPGAGTSNALNLTVTNPVAVLSSL